MTAPSARPTLAQVVTRLEQQQTRWMYDTLFRCASQTLLTFGRDPARLNGTLGITCQLHRASIARGLADADAGRMKPAEEVFKRLAKKHGA